jgi:hypothetical protein
MTELNDKEYSSLAYLLISRQKVNDFYGLADVREVTIEVTLEDGKKYKDIILSPNGM